MGSTMIRLFAYLKARQADHMHHQLFVLLSLIAAAGLSPAHALGPRKEDIDLEIGTIRLPEGDPPPGPWPREDVERFLASVCRRAGIGVVTLEEVEEYGQRCREQGIYPPTGEPLEG